MAERKKKTVEQRIALERRKLKKEFSFADDSRRQKLAEDLIERAAFMSVTLQDLELQIRENGCVSEYKNGENQWGTKKSPEVEIHMTMVKNYAATLRQLAELLPPEDPKAVSDDGFEAFGSLRS